MSARCEDCGDLVPKTSCWCQQRCVHVGKPANAASTASEPLAKLLEYCDESDNCCYGTLSTSLVRQLIAEHLASPPAPETGPTQSQPVVLPSEVREAIRTSLRRAGASFSDAYATSTSIVRDIEEILAAPAPEGMTMSNKKIETKTKELMKMIDAYALGYPYKNTPGVRRDELKAAITNAIGFEWLEGELQTVNASDLLRIALASQSTPPPASPDRTPYATEAEGEACTDGYFDGLAARTPPPVAQGEAIRFLQEVVMGNYKPHKIAAAAQKVLERLIPMNPGTPPPESDGQGLSDAEIEQFLRAAKEALHHMCKAGCNGVDELDEAITDFQHACTILAANPTAKPDGGSKA